MITAKLLNFWTCWKQNCVQVPWKHTVWIFYPNPWPWGHLTESMSVPTVWIKLATSNQSLRKQVIPELQKKQQNGLVPHLAETKILNSEMFQFWHKSALAVPQIIPVILPNNCCSVIMVIIQKQVLLTQLLIRWYVVVSLSLQWQRFFLLWIQKFHFLTFSKWQNYLTSQT